MMSRWFEYQVDSHMGQQSPKLANELDHLGLPHHVIERTIKQKTLLKDFHSMHTDQSRADEM